MSGTADTSGMPDVRSRRAFLDRDILRRNQTLEMELEFAPNLSSSEMRVVCGLATGKRNHRARSTPFSFSLSEPAFVPPL
jgi:hypothetical protein